MLSGLPWGRSSFFRNRVLGQFLANRVTHTLDEMFTLDGTPQGVVNQSLVSAFTRNCLVAGNDRRIEHDANALLRNSSTYGCLPFGTAYNLLADSETGTIEISLRQQGCLVFRSSQRFGSRGLFHCPANTFAASAKSSPCFARFACLFGSSHVNFTYGLYIRSYAYTIMICRVLWGRSSRRRGRQRLKVHSRGRWNSHVASPRGDQSRAVGGHRHSAVQ